jgi:hypothetical protein
MSYSKYGNERTRGYASKREANRAAELWALSKAGVIDSLKEQVRFEVVPATQLFRAVHYVADFVYTLDDVEVVEDAKGHRTKEYKLKQKLMFWRHGIRITEV